MSKQSHGTTKEDIWQEHEQQSDWTMQVVPHLPAQLQEQAHKRHPRLNADERSAVLRICCEDCSHMSTRRIPLRI